MELLIVIPGTGCPAEELSHSSCIQFGDAAKMQQNVYHMLLGRDPKAKS